MKGENNILLFGEFLGVTDQADSSKGYELHWETEDKTLVRDISASSRSIVIVLNDGTSYSLGYNAFGQLGIGSCAFCSNFTKVTTNTPFDKVTCGTNFTIWRSSTTNELFVSGKNFNSHPQRFSQPIKAISMDSYDDTFACIDESETVYLWSNFSNLNDFSTFLLPSKPSEISCGNGFASVLCNGYVFRIEKDGSFFPLFKIIKRPQNDNRFLSSNGSQQPASPAIVNASSSSVSSSSLSSSFRSMLAVSAKSAADFTVVLDTEGSVWLYGTIGGLKRRIESAPIAQRMRSIYAMPSFCAFVNNIGVTFALGLNDAGQLADGTKTKRTRAVETKVDKLVIDVVGGETFSVFVCSQFDSSLFEVNMDEFVPGHMNCPFEKAEDMIDATTTP